jgi:uncharacterized membrane protein
MMILALGLLIFLGLHSTRIVANDARAQAIARFGENGWKGVYSAVSAIGFILIVWGFAKARYDAPQLLAPPIWARHTTLLLMMISMVLLAAYLFKRSHIAVALHHPMVWSVVVFSAAHLIANGSAADALLFGAFLVWAVADLFSSYARDRHNAVIYPEPSINATIGALVLGLVFWVVIVFWLHPWLFGVSPIAA